MMRNCKFIHTDLAFEYYSNVDADIRSTVDSIKNPIGGTIRVDDVDDLIMDNTKIEPSRTVIQLNR